MKPPIATPSKCHPVNNATSSNLRLYRIASVTDVAARRGESVVRMMARTDRINKIRSRLHSGQFYTHTVSSCAFALPCTRSKRTSGSLGSSDGCGTKIIGTGPLWSYLRFGSSTKSLSALLSALSTTNAVPTHLSRQPSVPMPPATVPRSLDLKCAHDQDLVSTHQAHAPTSYHQAHQDPSLYIFYNQKIGSESTDKNQPDQKGGASCLSSKQQQEMCVVTKRASWTAISPTRYTYCYLLLYAQLKRRWSPPHVSKRLGKTGIADESETAWWLRRSHENATSTFCGVVIGGGWSRPCYCSLTAIVQ
jgi:hypothetical protein